MKRQIPKDYLDLAPELMPFYSWPPENPDFERIIEARKTSPLDRQTLVKVLLAQHQGLPNHALQLEHIRSLSDPDTFTLTTGHQVVLMGGPMFFIYKVLTIIKLAQQLDKELDSKIVPVFWMATEDHDFEEVNHFFPSFDKKVVYPGQFKGPVGRHIIEDSISGIYPDIPEKFQEYYREGKTFAAAFRLLCQDLFFGPLGLIIIDADDPELKSILRPVIKAELQDSTAANALKKQSRALEEAGYKVQLHIRDLNFFYMEGASRRRLIKTEEGIMIDGNEEVYTVDQMLEWVEQNPEKFSPNAAIRPLYQEMILPNLAYAGGWGELSYWMQLKELFNAFNVSFPLLLPRFSATLFETDDFRNWRLLGFEPTDIEREYHDLAEQYTLEIWDEDGLNKRIQAIDNEWQQLQKYVEQLDEGLGRNVGAEGSRLEKTFEKLRKKVRKSVRNQNPGPFRALESLKTKVQPDRTVQERVLNLTAFKSRAPGAWINWILAQIDPLDFGRKYLAPLDKTDIRKVARNLRSKLDPDDVRMRSEKIFQRWKDHFNLSELRLLHLFLSIQKNNEVDTQPFISYVNKTLPKTQMVIPVVQKSSDSLIHVAFGDDLELQKNHWGIPEPKVSKTLIKPAHLDMVLVPLLAFDGSGNRIGYGKGYYDKFLSQLRPECKKIGLCFETGYFPGSIPTEEHDIPLDFIITEKRLIRVEN